MQHENKKILTAILVIVLIISNVYLLYESQKSDYEILIGVPVKGEDDSAAVDYQKLKSLTEKGDRNTVLFSLLQARSIEKPKIMEQLADAVIRIGDPQAGISYAQITLWVDKSSIIAETGDGELPDYKEIAGNSFADELRNIIEKQTSLYYKKGIKIESI
ncbi:hypothetical protein FMM80_16125 [Schaedlerella arabinosiphila]|uniref:Uncharacterized protein n=1 Tax=Schaedlerella arabinosiphila TaxID=2044587 RepID=A0A9X5C8N6_9FIRM|nr:hypothetical protein [Schaedlerella arabinosiphila]KAI4443033.1 hypothetical protein C824_005559 [Schaedlerella arabinosiphila]MCI9633634.1 hypothetical protein [Ruminococcus sp.]NDO70094.1 hypothetical protein [Schaedlerella arabinosiphila]